MEPKTSSPEYLNEQPPQSIEYSLPGRAPEKSTEQQVERSPETNQELHRAVTSATTPPAVLPVPVQAQATDDAGTSSVAPVSSVSSPTTAADDDLIEKEWVDKAKKIITDTKEDPHTREQLVGKLQADYLRKRYGKQLGASE